MSDLATGGIALLGGLLGGTVPTVVLAARMHSRTRRGRARLVHEELYRVQSTVTRLYHQTDREGVPGPPEWLTPPLTDTEAQQDVITYLTGAKFRACVAALGWAALLRRGYGSAEHCPTDKELLDIYKQLECGRFAVAELARLEYSAHDSSFLAPEARRRLPREPLPALDGKEARAAMETQAVS